MHILKKLTMSLTAITLLSGCFNLYDMKNPYRKEGRVEELLQAELYLIKHGDETFRRTEDNYYMYVYWDSSECGGQTTYKRRQIEKEYFRHAPKIIENMKDTLYYKTFKDHDFEGYDHRFLPNKGLVNFIKREQKYIKLIKATDDYVCVSIQY